MVNRSNQTKPKKTQLMRKKVSYLYFNVRNAQQSIKLFELTYSLADD
jgi:hypothetical protein